MFVSFEESELKKAIETKDYLWLKAATINTMWNDPMFEHGETDALINVLKKQVPEIFVSEKKLPYEEHLERSLWNKDYFTDLTYWFRENFAESRIPYIKEVGKAVHKKPAKNKDVEKPKAGNKEKKMESKSAPNGNFRIARMIVAVVILVIILVLLVKNIFK